jgi:hypothetical protein
VCCSHIYILLHVHISFRENRFLVNKPLLRYATIDEAVFSMWPASSNSRITWLCLPLLSNGWVNIRLLDRDMKAVTSTVQAVFSVGSVQSAYKRKE